MSSPLPLLAEPLAVAVAAAGERRIPAEWLRRLRALLLAGRPVDAWLATSPRLRERLGTGPLLSSTVRAAERSPDGATRLLVGLVDGHAVETVVLPTPRGVSVCLSSQVGCPVRCRFCASGRDGLLRNLEAHEIVEQLVHARRTDRRVDRLVVMGIGEPLLNAERLFQALEVIRAEAGIGPRRMIVSTVGARGAVRRLLDYPHRVSLAVSLHAPDDALRRALIPTLAGDRVADLLADVDAWIAWSGRKALAEYTLLAGVNDGDDHAGATGALLAGRSIYLNVIPYNPVEGAPFAPVAAERARRFVDLVRAAGAFATVRKTLGAGADAACGQLRASRAAAAPAAGPAP